MDDYDNDYGGGGYGEGYADIYSDDEDGDRDGYGDEYGGDNDNEYDEYGRDDGGGAAAAADAAPAEDELQPEFGALDRVGVGLGATTVAGGGKEAQRLQRFLNQSEKNESQIFLDNFSQQFSTETEQLKTDYINWVKRIPRYWTKNIETIATIMKIIMENDISLKSSSNVLKNVLNDWSLRTKIEVYDLYRYLQLVDRYR